MASHEPGRTPIAQLSPDLTDQANRSVQGEVTITWPYSIATRTSAFRLAEPDFRLRNNKGQIRVEFVGPAGRAVSEAGIASGDRIDLSLEGVEWLVAAPPVRPNTSDHELRFKKRLRMTVKRAEGGEEALLDVQAADEEEEAPVQPVDIAAGNGAVSPISETPGVTIATPPPASKRSATEAFTEEEFASPAFLKRARVSYGSLWEGDFESLDDEKPRRKKKTRFSMHANWRYASRSPSPEPVRRDALEEDGMDEDEHVDNGEDEIPVTFMKPPSAKRMVDDGIQVDRSEGSPVAASSSPAQPEPSAPTANLAVPQTSPPPDSSVWGLEAKLRHAESATTSFAAQPKGTTSGPGLIKEQQPLATPHEPLTNTAGQPPLSMAHEDAASTLFGISTARESQPVSSAPTVQNNVFGSTALFGSGNAYPEPDDHELSETSHTGYSNPDKPAPAEGFDFSMQHDVAPFAPSQLEQAPWSTLTSMPPQIPLPTNTVENPVVLGSSSPTQEPGLDFTGDDIDDQRPEVKAPEEEDELQPPRWFSSARAGTSQGTDVGSKELSAATSQLIEDSPEASDGGSVAGEDYDLRNYDSAQDDDVVESDAEGGPPSNPNDPDEQVVDFDEDLDEDLPSEEEQQNDDGSVGNAFSSRGQVQKGEFEGDAGCSEGEDDSDNIYGDEEDEYDESDEMGQDDDGEEEALPAPSAPVFVSLLSDSEDDEQPPPRPAPARATQAQPSLSSAEPYPDRPLSASVDNERSEQDGVPFENRGFAAPAINPEPVEGKDVEHPELPAAQVPEEIVVKASRGHSNEGEDDTSDIDTPMDSDVEYDYVDNHSVDLPAAPMEPEAQNDESKDGDDETSVPARDEKPGSEPSSDVRMDLQSQHQDAASSPVVFEKSMSVDEVQPPTNQSVVEQPETHGLSIAEDALGPAQPAQSEIIDDSMSLVDTDQLRRQAVQLVEQSLASQLAKETPVIEIVESSVVIPSKSSQPEQTTLGFGSFEMKQPGTTDTKGKAKSIEKPAEAGALTQAQATGEIKSPGPQTSTKNRVGSGQETPEATSRQKHSETNFTEQDDAQQQVTLKSQTERVADIPKLQDVALSTSEPQHPTQGEAESLDDDVQAIQTTDSTAEHQLPMPRETSFSEDHAMGIDEQGLVEPEYNNEEEEYSILAEQQIRSEYESTQDHETQNNPAGVTTDDLQNPPTEKQVFPSIEAEAAREAMRLVIGDDPTEEEVFEYVEQRAKSEALEEVTADERTTQAASHDGSADQSFNDLSDSQAHRMTRSKVKLGPGSRRESGLFYSLRNRDHRKSIHLAAGEDGDRPALTATALSHLHKEHTEHKEANDPGHDEVATSPPTIHVTRSMAKDTNPSFKAESPPTLRVTGVTVDNGDPSLRMAMAADSPTPDPKKDAVAEPEPEASSQTRRNLRSQTPEPKRGNRQVTSSVSPTAARSKGRNLRSHSPAMAEAEKEKETVTSVKQKLGKQLRETLPDYLNLSSLRSHLNRVADYLAIVAATPVPSERVKNGPKDFMLELILTDPSSASSTTGAAVVVANVFRPQKKALPTVHAGDIILLRRFQVQAMAGRGYGLRSVDASAWAVFEKSDHDGLPQIKGPPVEIDDPEYKYVEGLRRWWTMVERDEKMLGKVEKAAADKAKKNKGR